MPYVRIINSKFQWPILKNTDMRDFFWDALYMISKNYANKSMQLLLLFHFPVSIWMNKLFLTLYWIYFILRKLWLCHHVDIIICIHTCHFCLWLILFTSNQKAAQWNEIETHHEDCLYHFSFPKMFMSWIVA